MIPFEIVFTTSPPAVSAPALSNTAAMTRAPASDRARDPTKLVHVEEATRFVSRRLFAPRVAAF